MCPIFKNVGKIMCRRGCVIIGPLSFYCLFYFFSTSSGTKFLLSFSINTSPIQYFFRKMTVNLRKLISLLI